MRWSLIPKASFSFIDRPSYLFMKGNYYESLLFLNTRNDVIITFAFVGLHAILYISKEFPKRFSHS